MIVSVVLPCYKSKEHVLGVLSNIGPEVEQIFAVDDACPDKTGKHIEQNCTDSRVTVLYHTENQGVGGAVVTGYKAALDSNADIVIKIDSDGQMDPHLIPLFIRPIISGHADYTKGNRFFDPKSLKGMPLVRLIGNASLSFFTKFSSGYWKLFDPTNGYTAIHKYALQTIDLDGLEKRYFFESDILMRLNISRAVVEDIPMKPVYGDEESNLQVRTALFSFTWKNIRNAMKRIFYNYFLRNFTYASVNLVFGILLFTGGFFLGLSVWVSALKSGVATTPGTASLITVLLILGFQLLMSFVAYDFQSEPTVALQKKMGYSDF